MCDFPDVPIRLAIASSPTHLPLVRGALERLCELIGFDEKARGEIVLAVDEALTNIIRHAYHGATDRPIHIEFRPVLEASGQRGLDIRLRDWGEVAEPARIRPRDLDDVRPGGLGVHLMRCCMDELRYEPAPGGGTLLTMVKNFSGRSNA